VLGVIALVVGILYLSGSVLGSHPTRGYAGIGAGVILLVIGIAGFVVGSRSRE
jgi:hypothetical protein